MFETFQMYPLYIKILFIYIIIISVISAAVTVYDKSMAIKHRWRVPENTLILLSAAGGSAAMYFTMLIIRHKTRHIKFMLGIPIILFFQIIAAYYFLRKMLI